MKSGLPSIKDEISLLPINVDWKYKAQDLSQMPQILKETTHVFENSTFARQIFGDGVVDPYATFYRNEQAVYDQFVTD